MTRDGQADVVKIMSCYALLSNVHKKRIQGSKINICHDYYKIDCISFMAACRITLQKSALLFLCYMPVLLSGQCREIYHAHHHRTI